MKGEGIMLELAQCEDHSVSTYTLWNFRVHFPPQLQVVTLTGKVINEGPESCHYYTRSTYRRLVFNEKLWLVVEWSRCQAKGVRHEKVFRDERCRTAEASLLSKYPAQITVRLLKPVEPQTLYKNPNSTVKALTDSHHYLAALSSEDFLRWDGEPFTEVGGTRFPTPLLQ